MDWWVSIMIQFGKQIMYKFLKKMAIKGNDLTKGEKRYISYTSSSFKPPYHTSQTIIPHITKAGEKVASPLSLGYDPGVMKLGQHSALSISPFFFPHGNTT